MRLRRQFLPSALRPRFSVRAPPLCCLRASHPPFITAPLPHPTPGFRSLHHPPLPPPHIHAPPQRDARHCGPRLHGHRPEEHHQPHSRRPAGPRHVGAWRRRRAPAPPPLVPRRISLLPRCSYAPCRARAPPPPPPSPPLPPPGRASSMRPSFTMCPGRTRAWTARC